MTEKEAYYGLRDAIISQAVKDYYTLLDCGSITGEFLEDTERFFISEWFETLTQLDGSEVLKEIRRQYAERERANPALKDFMIRNKVDKYALRRLLGKPLKEINRLINRQLSNEVEEQIIAIIADALEHGNI